MAAELLDRREAAGADLGTGGLIRASGAHDLTHRPEVDQGNLPARLNDQIRGFDVAMDDRRLTTVQILEDVEHLEDDIAYRSLAQAGLAAEPQLQILPVDEVLDQVEPAAQLDEGEQ